MKPMPLRILSFLLALLLTTASATTVFAAEAIPPEIPIRMADEAPPEQAGLPEPTQTILPYGFVGLPSSYALTAEQWEDKAQLAAAGAVEAARGAQPGIDYVPDEVFFPAHSEDYARMVAEAYRAELLSFAQGIAVIRLTGAAVWEAVAAAANPNLPLPAVEPNYLFQVDPVEEKPVGPVGLDSDAGAEVPTTQSWADWYASTSQPDPFLSDPGSHSYQWMHDMVNSYEAWGSSTGEGITVAIIDTGVQANHEDLDGKVRQVQVGDVPTAPSSTHGTHVAGIVAASMGNGKGGAGIAPDASILSLNIRYPDSRGMSYANILRGIQAAIDEGAQVINMSLGGIYDQAQAVFFQEQVDLAVESGLVVVVSMGNDGTAIQKLPASLDHVIAVTNVDWSGAGSASTTYGKWADIAAPGTNINSTISSSATNGYGFQSGTSMAAPVVSGAAALYLSKVPDATPAEVEKALKDSVNKVTGKDMGKGILDAAQLFQGDKTAPVIQLSDSGLPVTNLKLPVGFSSGTLTLLPGDGATNNAMFLYTTDGKNPAVKNGQVVHGTIAEEGEMLRLSELFPAHAGKKVTVKALCISGQGDVSKVASLSFSLSYNSTVEGVTISSPDSFSLVSGKSLQLSAAVSPASADQSVEWSLSASGVQGVRLDQKGKLITGSLSKGLVTVTATSKADPSRSASVTVTIDTLLPLGTITLNEKKLTLGVGSGIAEQGQLSIAQLLDSKKGAVDPATRPFSWSSNKPTVATVDEQGLVTAVAPGTATITLTALDGSGKRATCTVTVIQYVEQIVVTGQRDLAQAQSATFKAELLPKQASNKKIIWSVDDAALAAGVTVSTSGKVTLPKQPIQLMSITLTATAQDQGGVSSSFFIRVVGNKSTAVMLGADNSGDLHHVTYTERQGALTALTLYNTDLISTDDWTDNRFILRAEANGGCGVTWSTNKAAVAAVEDHGDGTCTVIGQAAGSATITATATDGSNKKATLTVTVSVPPSSLQLTAPKQQPIYTDYYLLAPGKSIAFSATLGDAYGKPSNKKVFYEVMLEAQASYEGSEMGLSDIASQSGQPHLQQAAQQIDALLNGLEAKKLVTISASGQLATKAAMSGDIQQIYDIWESYGGTEHASGLYVYAHVLAYTEVGGCSDLVTVELLPSGTTKLRAGAFVSSSSYVVQTTYTTSAGSARELHMYVDSDCPHGYFEITSSNPDVAGVSKSKSYSRELFVYTTGRKGTARITIKALDGTNKSYSFSIQVK